jgi:N-carbamoyl-L-amino-acid hydrolase
MLRESPERDLSQDRPELARAERFLAELRAKTADPPGVSRASYGDGEQIAHDMARRWAEELDLVADVDFAGNLYLTLPGTDRALPRVMMGSHMDSVPHGGNYDGAAGVVAGLGALQRLRRLGVRPRMDVTVMAIRAEEVSWFPAPYIGSRAAFGLLPPAVLDEVVRFDTGQTLASHLEDRGFDPESVRRGARYLDPAGIRAYIEVHIEQGPELVKSGQRCAVVTHIRGNYRYKHCRVVGEYAHAGAVPRLDRRDALFAAVEFARALEEMWVRRETSGEDLVCTVGQFFTDPEVHTITKIPGEVRFTMDFRSADEAVLASCHAELEDNARRISQKRGVTIELGPRTHAPVAVMDQALVTLADRCSHQLGIDAPRMASGAGHDCAIFAKQGVPSAMIFIRNFHSSHNPHEEMALEDFAEATRVLDAMLDEIVA